MFKNFLKRLCLFIILIALTLGAGCSRDNDPPGGTTVGNPVIGHVEKGPFEKGSEVIITELDKGTLLPTGKTASSKVLDNAGSYQISHEFESSIVDIQATGYYFNENTGEISDGSIRLSTISDIRSEKETEASRVNINILTTLIHERVVYLATQEGFSIKGAIKQAEPELLNALEIPEDIAQNLVAAGFNNISINGGDKNSAALFAISAMLQGDHTTEELSELISKIEQDITTDGNIDDSSIKDRIKTARQNMDSEAGFEFTSSYYSQNGLTFDTNESQIIRFGEKITEDEISPPAEERYVWYQDLDGDGFGDPGTFITDIIQPAGYVSDNTDPDDRDNTIFPGSKEICGDAVDNDQDGSIDENCENTVESIENDYGMTFSRIPEGSFMMGSPEDEPGRKDDETQHPVTLTQDFYMQTTEVTQKQWKWVMGSLPPDVTVEDGMGDNFPVYGVSWNDVTAFLTTLNNLTTDTYRLPTEAEWEYACRSNSTQAFSNGGITETGCVEDANLAEIGWYCFHLSGKCNPVAGKIRNIWNLYDMHGNLSEWCSDFYGPYSSSDTDPVGPSYGSQRVLRGGNYTEYSRNCRSAHREKMGPATRNILVGFRLVRLP